MNFFFHKLFFQFYSRMDAHLSALKMNPAEEIKQFQALFRN